MPSASTIRLSRRDALAATMATIALTALRPTSAHAIGTVPTRWLDVTQSYPGCTPVNFGDPATLATRIQTYLDAANPNVASGNDSGAVIYLPTGQYQLNKGLYLRKNTWLVGDGPGTILQPTTDFDDGHVIVCDDNPSRVATATVISDLKIKIPNGWGATHPVNGIAIGTPGTNLSGQSFADPDGSQLVHNVTMFGITGAGIYIGQDSRGVWLSHCTILGRQQAAPLQGVGLDITGPDSQIDNVTCRDLDTGFHIDSTVRRLSNCRAGNNKVGFWVTRGHVQMSNCQAHNNTVHGFWFYPGDGSVGLSAVHGCSAYDNGGHGFYLDHYNTTYPNNQWVTAYSMWGIQSAGNGASDLLIGNPASIGETGSNAPDYGRGIKHSCITGTASNIVNVWPNRQVNTAAGIRLQNAYIYQ